MFILPNFELNELSILIKKKKMETSISTVINTSLDNLKDKEVIHKVAQSLRRKLDQIDPNTEATKQLFAVSILFFAAGLFIGSRWSTRKQRK